MGARNGGSVEEGGESVGQSWRRERKMLVACCRSIAVEWASRATGRAA